MTTYVDNRFSIDEHLRDGALILSVIGELDIASAPLLDHRLQSLRREERPVRLDLSRLEFIDSTGVHVLLEAWQSAEQAGSRLVVECDVTPQVRRVLELTRLDDVLLGDRANAR